MLFRNVLILVSSLVIICNLSSQDLGENLLLNYNFENNYLDASINVFHGLNSQTTFTEDRFGNPENAALFNGDSYVETPNLPILKPNFPFSVACWINPEVEFIRAEGIWGNDQTLDNYFGAFVSILSSGKLMAGYGDGCGTTGPQCRRSFITDEILENGNWYHIAVNFLDPLNIEIYINGCLVTTSFSGTGSTSLVYSDQPGAVGKKDHNDDPSHPIGYFHGVIDDFFYWNRTINSDDLQLLIGSFFSEPDSIITYAGCQNDGYEVVVNNVVYNELNPTGIEYSTSPNSCEEVEITIDLQFNETSTEIIENVTCSGDGFEVVVNSTLYNESNPVGQEIFINQFGCDSTIIINLEFNPPETQFVEYSGCSGDEFEIIVNGTIYDENNPTGQESFINQLGCDSTVIINLEFNPPETQFVEYSGCSGDEFEINVNATIYDESNPTGQEVLVSQFGCDSTVIINLEFNPAETQSIEYSGCSGDDFETIVNATIYDESNPTGQEIFINQFGCDSIINIDLTYNGYEAEVVDYEGWSGDGFEVIVNNTVYNENNPVGQEVLTDQFGCDSTIIIDLKYYKKCSFYIPNTFSNNSKYPNNRFSLFSSNECVPLDLKVEIFDSWGNLIFSSIDIDFEWDGMFNGQQAKQGIYVYLIKLNTERESFNLAGSVMFLR